MFYHKTGSVLKKHEIIIIVLSHHRFCSKETRNYYHCFITPHVLFLRNTKLLSLFYHITGFVRRKHELIIIVLSQNRFCSKETLNYNNFYHNTNEENDIVLLRTLIKLEAHISLFIVYCLIDMLDSDWCIVGSRMTARTLDVKLDWNIISNRLDSPHQEIWLPSYSGYGFRSEGELWSWVIDNISLEYVLMSEYVNWYPWNLSNLIYIMYLCMFLWAMYCVCMHTFQSAHICMVFNSVKCVHYFYH